MKLLICTQKVDKNDPILGFFHDWIKAFALRSEAVTVICLQKGEYEFPENVTVYSLGKEKGSSKFSQLAAFYRYVFKFHSQYDSVFVHMNQMYVLLGGMVWRILGKKIGLWYAHGSVTASLRAAVLFTHRCFTSTELSFRIATPKRRIVGHGVNTEVFSPAFAHALVPNTARIISIARLSPVKHFETVIEAVRLLLKKNVDARLMIVGGPGTPEQEKYQEELKALVEKNNLTEAIDFAGEKRNVDVAPLLNSSDIFVNASLTGSLDKTMLEALSCGVPVFSSNPNLRIVLLQDPAINAGEFMFEQKNAVSLADKISHFLLKDAGAIDDHKKRFRDIIVAHYALSQPVEKILKEYQLLLR